MKPTTDREREIRRKAHAIAILYNLTMREAVYWALELLIKHEEDLGFPKK